MSQASETTDPSSGSATVMPQASAARPDDAGQRMLDPTYEAEIAAIEDDLLAEIERVQREAAERERTLIAERDAYRAQLQFATDTKAWRASTAYWRAREQGLAGVLGLGGQFGTYLLRVGYHLGVPYPVRRDLWYRRHTGRSYRSYYRMLGATEANASLDASAAPERVRKVAGPDALIFGARDWSSSTPAQRRLAAPFAESERRCVWVRPRLTSAPAGEVGVVAERRIAAPGMADPGLELALPGDGSDVTTNPVFRRSALRHALAALRRYCFDHDLREVVCVIQHPGWAPLVEALRQAYGWKVVYDLADGALNGQEQGERLVSALTLCDLVLASAPDQREWLARQGAPETHVAVVGSAEDEDALAGAVTSLYGRATIIIVTYRNLDKTRLTVKSVLEKTRYPNYEILLVDNGGEPDIQQYARDMAERFPNVVRCIFNEKNLGFAGGNNVGLRAAPESEYIVLLNDDVIVSPGWLGGLLRYLDDPHIGLIGPVTNSAGNEARIAVDYSDIAEVDAFARRYTFAHDGVNFNIPVLAMYCMAARRRTIDELGELDERFRMGMFEDDDYAVRARNAGYRVVCAEDVYVHHFGRSSFGKMSEEAHDKIFAANRALFERKWGTTWSPHKYREG